MQIKKNNNQHNNGLLWPPPPSPSPSPPPLIKCVFGFMRRSAQHRTNGNCSFAKYVFGQKWNERARRWAFYLCEYCGRDARARARPPNQYCVWFSLFLCRLLKDQLQKCEFVWMRQGSECTKTQPKCMSATRWVIINFIISRLFAQRNSPMKRANETKLNSILSKHSSHRCVVWCLCFVCVCVAQHKFDSVYLWCDDGIQSLCYG